MIDEAGRFDWQEKIKGAMFFQTHLMMRQSEQTIWSSKNTGRALTLIVGKIIYGVVQDKKARIHTWK